VQGCLGAERERERASEKERERERGRESERETERERESERDAWARMSELMRRAVCRKCTFSSISPCTCKNQFPHKSVNLSSILVIIKSKSTDLREN
jgi:hypothetical protein